MDYSNINYNKENYVNAPDSFEEHSKLSDTIGASLRENREKGYTTLAEIEAFQNSLDPDRNAMTNAYLDQYKNNFKKTINNMSSNFSDLDKNNITSLISQYNGRIVPLKNKWDNLQELRKNQADALAKDRTLRFSTDYNTMSFDNFAFGNRPETVYSESGNDLYDKAKETANKILSVRFKQRYNQSDLINISNNTEGILNEIKDENWYSKGYNSGAALTALDAMNNFLTNPEAYGAVKGDANWDVIATMYQMIKDSNIKYMDIRDQWELIDQVKDGIFQGLIYEDDWNKITKSDYHNKPQKSSGGGGRGGRASASASAGVETEYKRYGYDIDEVKTVEEIGYLNNSASEAYSMMNSSGFGGDNLEVKQELKDGTSKLGFTTSVTKKTNDYVSSPNEFMQNKFLSDCGINKAFEILKKDDKGQPLPNPMEIKSSKVSGNNITFTDYNGKTYNVGIDKLAENSGLAGLGKLGSNERVIAYKKYCITENRKNARRLGLFYNNLMMNENARIQVGTKSLSVKQLYSAIEANPNGDEAKWFQSFMDQVTALTEYGNNVNFDDDTIEEEFNSMIFDSGIKKENNQYITDNTVKRTVPMSGYYDNMGHAAAGSYEEGTVYYPMNFTLTGGRTNIDKLLNDSGLGNAEYGIRRYKYKPAKTNEKNSTDNVVNLLRKIIIKNANEKIDFEDGTTSLNGIFNYRGSRSAARADGSLANQARVSSIDQEANKALMKLLFKEGKISEDSVYDNTDLGDVTMNVIFDDKYSIMENKDGMMADIREVDNKGAMFVFNFADRTTGKKYSIAVDYGALKSLGDISGGILENYHNEINDLYDNKEDIDAQYQADANMQKQVFLCESMIKRYGANSVIGKQYTKHLEHLKEEINSRDSYGKIESWEKQLQNILSDFTGDAFGDEYDLGSEYRLTPWERTEKGVYDGKNFKSSRYFKYKTKSN